MVLFVARKSTVKTLLRVWMDRQIDGRLLASRM